MKNLILTITLAFVIGLIHAQKASIQIGESTIKSDFDVNHLLDKDLEKSKKTDKIPGYRIQIISSNSKSEVIVLRDKVAKEFKNTKDYVIYDQPYYKLRMGDFKTRLEAIKFLEAISPSYPSAFLVKDDIKIK
jgi:hypothetical protein